MNIFWLNELLKKCAEEHCDKHIVKMILETAQLLYSAKHLVEPNELWHSDVMKLTGRGPYRLTHKNHPCAKWARECHENYMTLVTLGIFLCKEYTFRYERRHATESHIWYLLNNPPKLPSVPGGTTRPIAISNKELHKDTVVESYRNYYIQEKSSFAKWTKRSPPKWYIKAN